MIRRISMAALALLIAVPLAAQAPAGLQLRTEGSTNAADPDDVPDVTVATVGSGFQINTGPAVIAWDDGHLIETVCASHLLRLGDRHRLLLLQPPVLVRQKGARIEAG